MRFCIGRYRSIVGNVSICRFHHLRIIGVAAFSADATQPLSCVAPHSASVGLTWRVNALFIDFVAFFSCVRLSLALPLRLAIGFDITTQNQSPPLGLDSPAENEEWEK